MNIEQSLCARSEWCISILKPFRTAVTLCGQTTQILSRLSPKRVCGTARANRSLPGALPCGHIAPYVCTYLSSPALLGVAGAGIFLSPCLKLLMGVMNSWCSLVRAVIVDSPVVFPRTREEEKAHRHGLLAPPPYHLDALLLTSLCLMLSSSSLLLLIVVLR